MAFEEHVLMPGHGPVFHDRAPVDATLRYLRFVLDLAERGRVAGVRRDGPLADMVTYNDGRPLTCLA